MWNLKNKTSEYNKKEIRKNKLGVRKNRKNKLGVTLTRAIKRCKLFYIKEVMRIYLTTQPQKIKSDTVSTVSPSNSHEMMGADAMILVF